MLYPTVRKLTKLVFTLCRSLFVRENGKLATYTVLLLGANPPLIFYHMYVRNRPRNQRIVF